MLKKLGPFITTSCALWLAGSPAYADFFVHRWEGHHENAHALRLAPELSYYTSSSNYDADGAVVTPASLTGYSRMALDLELSYGLSRAATFYGRLDWGRAQIESTALSANAYGLADQSLGLSFRVFESETKSKLTPYSVDLQGQVDLPAYDNKTAQQKATPFLGDATTDFSVGAWATLPLSETQESHWVLLGGLAYSKRSDEFSSALPWGARVRYSRLPDSMAFSVGAQGLFSLKSDLTTHTAGGSGSSNYINAVNPSLVWARGVVELPLSTRTGLTLALNKSVFGQNTPSAFMVNVGAVFRWDDSLPTKRPERMTESEYRKSNKGFVDYNFEGKVLRTNDRMGLVKIDKGSADGVAVGQIFDIFATRSDGSAAEAIARAECTAVKSNEAALSIREYYKEVWIDAGFIVKRPLQ